MSLGYNTDDTSQLHPRDVLFNLLFLFIVAHRNIDYVTTRNRLVTTGEAGDSRNVDGSRVSSMGLAPQPVSSVRRKPKNPW